LGWTGWDGVSGRQSDRQTQHRCEIMTHCSLCTSTGCWRKYWWQGRTEGRANWVAAWHPKLYKTLRHHWNNRKYGASTSRISKKIIQMLVIPVLRRKNSITLFLRGTKLFACPRRRIINLPGAPTCLWQAMTSEDEKMVSKKQLQEMTMTFIWIISLTEMSGESSGRPRSQRSVSTTMSVRNISQRSSYTDKRQKLIWRAFQLLRQMEAFLLVPRSDLILSQT